MSAIPDRPPGQTSDPAPAHTQQRDRPPSTPSPSNRQPNTALAAGAGRLPVTACVQ